MVYYPYYICCSTCKHRNRPDSSPRRGIEKALRGNAGNCKGCGKKLRPTLSTERPMTREIKARLEVEGVKLAKPGHDIDWVAPRKR